MPGILLDTHALYWLVTGEEELTAAALLAIGRNQEAGTLFVSPVSAWELSIATRKNRASDRPYLGEDPPGRWFGEALRATSARIISIGQSISIEAANVVAATGHKDPGDCFLMATARVRRIPLVTRDTIIRTIAVGKASYLDIIEC